LDSLSLKRNKMGKRRKQKDLPKDIDSYLNKRYYDPKRPAAFTSTQKLFESIKREGRYKIPLKRINEWGETQDSITLHRRPIYKGRPQRKVIVGLNNSVFDVDLLVLNQKRFTSANAGYSYILCAIDILSRHGYLAAIKSKSPTDVIKGFKDIFERVTHLPRSICSDHGIEFSSKEIQSFFKDRGINHYMTNSSHKANYSEIFIRGVKKRLFRIFQRRGSYKYLDILEDVEKSYNNTFHTGIHMKPSDVNETNQEKVWFNSYYPPKAYKTAFIKAIDSTKKHRNVKSDPFKYEIGDQVRISYLKEPFMRDYEERWSGEVYTITSKKLFQGTPTYKLKDYSGDQIKGYFNQWEIQKVTFDPNKSFSIDKVLKTRTKDGVKESFVTFSSWPKKYAQWIPTANIKPIGLNK
jgi:hypothetical protein